MLDRVDPRALVRYADERHSAAPPQRVEAQGLGIWTRRAVEGNVDSFGSRSLLQPGEHVSFFIRIDAYIGAVPSRMA